MMGLMLSVSLIAGGTIGVYASDTTKTATESSTEAAETDSEKTSETDAKEDVAEEDAVYGEVKSVDGDTITFTVGTRNEAPGMEKPDGEAQKARDTEKSDEKESEPETAEEPDSKDFLTLTFEEREVTVSDDTEIVKGMMFDGEKPMAEEADQKDTEEASEKETTEAASEEETTEATSEEVTEKDAKDQAPEAQEQESISVSDIKAGDIIKVTYDKDNNVTRIEVMSTPEEKPGDTEEKASEQEEGSEEETTETATEETTES